MEEANKIMMDDNFNEVRVGLQKPFTFTLDFCFFLVLRC